MSKINWNQESISKIQRAFYEADEAGCTLEECWVAALNAMVELPEVRVLLKGEEK